MPTGWEQLGNVLGGGIDRAGAYETGRLRTAQTESALGLAQQRQLENIALEAKNKARAEQKTALAKTGVDPNVIDLLDSLMTTGAGSDYSAGMTGLKTGQEMGFRDTLADPNAALGDQFAAGQGVQGKVLPRNYQVGAGGYTDLLDPNAAVQDTPLGDSMITENRASEGASNALADLRRVQAGDPGYRVAGSGGSSVTSPSGLKTPPNMYPNPDFNPALPISGENPPFLVMPLTPADINAPRPLGTNALTQFSRVVNAAGNTALDLATIVSMPSGASSGLFGSTTGKGLLSMVPANLTNAVTPVEVQQYKAIMDTLGEQLSTIERMGLRGSQGLAQKFDSLALLPTDNVFTKMLKLAQMRQSVENGMDTLLALNSLPDDLRARIEFVKQASARSIPFTPRDVLTFQQQGAKNRNLTLAEMLKTRGAKFNTNEQGMIPQGTTPAAPAASSEAPMERWERGADGKLHKVSSGP